METKTVTVRRFLHEGQYWTAEELIEHYGAANGVTASTFKTRMRHPERWTITSALFTEPKSYIAQRGIVRDKIQVVFPQFIPNIFPHMQPLLNTVYNAVHVKFNAAAASKHRERGTDEYVIITLENGKKLLAYRGEYSVVRPCSG